VIRNGGQINENDSHCRVTDEQNRLRINVTIPPRSVRFPTLCIRNTGKSRFASGIFKMAACLANRRGLVMALGGRRPLRSLFAAGALPARPPCCGPSGRNAASERVLVAESDSELYPEKPCCLLQRIKKPHEGGRRSAVRLVRDGLTMSLDTYCIGEIVGDEALAFIHAAFRAIAAWARSMPSGRKKCRTACWPSPGRLREEKATGLCAA
jgi:pilus assembly protein CpaF